jgi:hypothetical protein
MPVTSWRALGKFMKILRKKRPEMAASNWLFQWDNALVHTAVMVINWMAARQIRLIENPLYALDQAGFILTQDTFKKEWESTVWSIEGANFAEAFRRWRQRHEKCVVMGSGYVEKI